MRLFKSHRKYMLPKKKIVKIDKIPLSKNVFMFTSILWLNLILISIFFSSFSFLLSFLNPICTHNRFLWFVMEFVFLYFHFICLSFSICFTAISLDKWWLKWTTTSKHTRIYGWKNNKARTPCNQMSFEKIRALCTFQWQVKSRITHS